MRQSKESLKKVKDVVDIKTKKIMQQRLLLMESDAELTEAMSLLRGEKVNGTTPPPSIIFPPPRVLPGKENPAKKNLQRKKLPREWALTLQIRVPWWQIKICHRPSNLPIRNTGSRSYYRSGLANFAT